MNTITIHHPTGNIVGEINLSGSKSISNRALLIRALSGQHFDITNLSNSDDTVTMQKLIQDVSTSDILDAHHAGTTFRFLSAYLAIKTKKPVVLTGSERMQQRPIKALVEALNSLGANISYTGVDGFPPLKIDKPFGEWKDTISLPADISSQYISALLMIGPYLPNGLKINLIGNIVSLPYIEMTISMMKYFGGQVSWVDSNNLQVYPVKYSPLSFYVEADWSSASYFYSMVALAEKSDIIIHGLQQDSLQGDSKVSEIYSALGVETVYENNSIRIKKLKHKPIEFYEYDFLMCPDLAQTVTVSIGGLGINGLYSGLQTLYIKETDRVSALMSELAKYGVFLSKLPQKFSQKSGITYYSQEGEASLIDSSAQVATYNDHRMAMAFAPLGIKFPIRIENPLVVSKSYPFFWADLKKLGFEISD